MMEGMDGVMDWTRPRSCSVCTHILEALLCVCMILSQAYGCYRESCYDEREA